MFRCQSRSKSYVGQSHQIKQAPTSCSYMTIVAAAGSSISEYQCEIILCIHKSEQEAALIAPSRWPARVQSAATRTKAAASLVTNLVACLAMQFQPRASGMKNSVAAWRPLRISCDWTKAGCGNRPRCRREWIEATVGILAVLRSGRCCGAVCSADAHTAPPPTDSPSPYSGSGRRTRRRTGEEPGGHQPRPMGSQGVGLLGRLAENDDWADVLKNVKFTICHSDVLLSWSKFMNGDYYFEKNCRCHYFYHCRIV